MTKSLGFNLWKGNNPFATVEGSLSGKAHEHDKIFEEIKKIPCRVKKHCEVLKLACLRRVFVRLIRLGF